MDSSQVFENIHTDPTLTKNSLTVIEILSQFSLIDISSARTSRDDQNGKGSGFFNWNLFGKKGNKTENKSIGNDLTRTVNSVAFRDIDLVDKLLFWKQKYYKKAGVEVVFYDNLGAFDTGMQMRETNFSEDTGE